MRLPFIIASVVMIICEIILITLSVSLYWGGQVDWAIILFVVWCGVFLVLYTTWDDSDR